MPKISKQAQSIIELAVFGAVLFFLIAAIASVYLSGSLQQNAMLKTMRTAFYKSYNDSAAGYAARASASFLLYEDRTSGEFGKFGTSDRSPIAMSGSGAMSKNQLLTVDFGETYNLALIDYQINGQKFSFTTRAFVMLKVVRGYDNVAYVAQYSGSLTNAADDLDDDGVHDWMEACYGGSASVRLTSEWGTGTLPLIYESIVASDANYSTTATNATARFDYNRNGTAADDLPSSMWDTYATWQWYPTAFATVLAAIDEDNGSYPTYDIDADRYDENLYNLESFAAGSLEACGGQAAYAVEISTTKQAEWDAEEDDEVSDEWKQGIKKDMFIKTATQDADGKTYLDIKEGTKYLSNGKPVQQSILKKTQYDIIERVLQLNPYMDDTAALISRNKDIEQVNGCADSVYTCFDTSTKRLYIRSRISDKRGHKWVTSTDQTFNQVLRDK